MKTSILVGLSFFLMHQISFAVVGGVNSVKDIPLQLCQIVPVKKGIPQGNMTCSALLVESHVLRTAGHCGFDSFNDKNDGMVVDCMNGKIFNLTQTQMKWTFLDPEGPLNPRLKVQDWSRVGLDVALLQFPKSVEMGMPPLKEVNLGKVEDFFFEGKTCFLVGTGTDQYSRWGHAQAKAVLSENIKILDDGVVFIEGESHVKGHDSGGALVCDGVYTATIVAQKATNSVLALGRPVATHMTQDLLSCPGEAPSEALKTSVTHFMGFTEVRDYIHSQQAHGLQVCFGGVTLSKNQYQYFKNLIFVKFFDGANVLQKQTTIHFQASSVQGHHSPEGRPWVVLDSAEFNKSFFEDLMGESWSFSFTPLNAPYPAGTLEEVVPVKAKESSVMFLESKSGLDYYLVTWLQQVAGTGANLYTTEVSPKFALFTVDQNSQVNWEKKTTSAFQKILMPAENLLEKANKEVQGMSDDGKQEFIESLSTLK